MTVTARNLVPAKLVENYATIQYTVPTNITVTLIDKFTATSVSASSATISVNLVTKTYSPDNSNLIIKAKVLSPSETYTFPELVGQILPTGSYISTVASAASAINMRVSGREVS